jgi:hypothetical protein
MSYRRMYHVSVLLLSMILPLLASAQGTWVWTGRVHSELDWYTLETEHFNVHYHNGIEDMAREGATYAEQIRTTLMEQIGVTQVPMIDIIFTTEDEIMNGFALWTNQTFIWIDQNDATIWLENGKWLQQVLAHELQHIIYFNAVKSWLPQPWSFLISQTPGWFVEGLAEYCTENWRPYRSDIRHKYRVFNHQLDNMDAHHDGYSKVLLLTSEYGDSTLAKLVSHRKMGINMFPEAFKEATGITVDQFVDHWDEVMNTYYYSYKSQHETYQETGEVFALPLAHVSTFALAADSSRIALVGRDDRDQLDRSLIVGDRVVPETEDDEESWETTQSSWDKRTIDYGQFHERITFSPDATQLAYAKYRYGLHGSMLWDLRVADLETDHNKWITFSQRASWPDWSPDGKSIVFISHTNSVTNLFLINPDGTDLRQLTHFQDNTQIVSPRFSPDGHKIACAISGPDGNMNLALVDVATGMAERITNNPEVEYLPVWHPDGKRITFTSHAGYTPNLHTITLKDNSVVQNTDVGEAVWSVQWTPGGNSVMASTMNTVDSVRVVLVDPDRTITTEEFRIRAPFTAWLQQHPEQPLPLYDPNNPAQILSNHRYNFLHHWKHITSIILPVDVLAAGTIWSDALGKHLYQVIVGTTWDFQNPFYYLSYVNAQHGPLWQVSIYHNVNWTWRPYDRSDNGLLELSDGASLSASIPLNFGNSLSSNHDLSTSLAMHHRSVRDLKDWNSTEDDFVTHLPGGLPQPEEGNESLFGLNYRWVNRRPHRDNITLPGHGWGVNLNSTFALGGSFGDFNYQRYSLNTFINQKLPGGVLFLQLKGTLLEGDAPAQDYVGFTTDFPIYSAGANDLAELFPENHNLRGNDEIRLGDRMLLGTVEFRLPFLDGLPLSAFGFEVGQITASLFSDFGDAWHVGQMNNTEYLLTAGYEAKIAIQVGNAPLFFLAIGQAQEPEQWQDTFDGADFPEPYLRCGLINPF